MKSVIICFWQAFASLNLMTPAFISRFRPIALFSDGFVPFCFYFYFSSTFFMIDSFSFRFIWRYDYSFWRSTYAFLRSKCTFDVLIAFLTFEANDDVSFTYVFLSLPLGWLFSFYLTLLSFRLRFWHLLIYYLYIFDIWVKFLTFASQFWQLDFVFEHRGFRPMGFLFDI